MQIIFYNKALICVQAAISSALMHYPDRPCGKLNSPESTSVNEHINQSSPRPAHTHTHTHTEKDYAYATMKLYGHQLKQPTTAYTRRWQQNLTKLSQFIRYNQHFNRENFQRFTKLSTLAQSPGSATLQTMREHTTPNSKWLIIELL